MAGLLRRLRRTKEPEPQPEPTSSDEAASGPTATPEEGLGDDATVEEENLAATTPQPIRSSPPETPAGPPPPLPQADQDAGRSSIARHRPQSKCFLCGTDLDGPWCPTCRMAWSD